MSSCGKVVSLVVERKVLSRGGHLNLCSSQGQELGRKRHLEIYIWDSSWCTVGVSEVFECIIRWCLKLWN